jgi:hypothetical protein
MPDANAAVPQIPRQKRWLVTAPKIKKTKYAALAGRKSGPNADSDFQSDFYDPE